MSSASPPIKLLDFKRSKNNPNTGWTMLVACCIVILSLIFDASIAQGVPPSRRWSVRKTGEFGRKIVENIASESSPNPARLPISKELELPSRLTVAESRNNAQFFRGAGSRASDLEIRKPSLNLELPRFAGLRNFVADQEAQETEDREGYAYPKPDSAEDEVDGAKGYVYTTPSPSVRYTDPPAEDPTTVPPELPVGGVPIVTGFESMASEDIDSEARSPPGKLSPQVVGVATDDQHKTACSGSDDDPACWPHGYEGVIPGKAGEDYPVLSEIIETPFSCDEQPFSGYYADTDPQARCQIFHICLKRNRNRKTQQWSFLCPNGTIFSQPDFVCVWWGDAPQCSDAMVRSLYNLNEQLGWDNVTEGSGGQRQGGGELQGAMSAFNAKLASNKPSTALPYRVPVKVPDANSGRARTKLQEVTQNALHGQAQELDYGEHEGEESSNFETSLRKQMEARSKSKSGSSSRKSVSEGYELKGSEDMAQPFIVNREPPLAPTVQPQDQDVVMMPTLQRFPDGSEGYGEVAVMLPHHTTTVPPSSETHSNLQQGYGANDDEEGYQYPNPTSTPAPTYLPPRRTTAPPTTTEYFPPPTVPTEPPIPPTDHDNYEQQSPDRLATSTQEPEEGYRYPQPTTTEYPQEETGYNYPNPGQSQTQQQQALPQENQDEDGYQYPQPTTATEQTGTTEGDEQGYRYPNPTTTQRSSRFRQTNAPTTETAVDSTTEFSTPAEEEGYNYAVPENPSKFESLRETTQVEEGTTGYSYPRPSTTTETYPELSTQQSADIVREESTTTSLPTTTSELEQPAGGYLPPKSGGNQQSESNDANATTEEVEYEDDEEVNEVATGISSSTGSAGYSGNDDESGYSYHVPTPPSSSSNEIVLNGGTLDSDDKLNEILKQVQSGNIEAVDSSGKPIEFSKLKDLLLNSPRGSVDLKSELDSVTASSTDSNTTPSSGYSLGQVESRRPSQQQQPQISQPAQQPPQQYYHTVTTATILPNNNPQNNNLFNTNHNSAPTSGGLTAPTGLYLPPTNGFNREQNAVQQPLQQQQYYNGNNNNNNEIVQYVDHPSYEIKLPSREFETHSLDQNTIAVDNSANNQNRPFSQQQPQSGYYQQRAPQTNRQFFQQRQPTNNYLPPQPQAQVQQHTPRPDYDRTNALNNVVLPTPQPQRQPQQQNSNFGNFVSNSPTGEYLPPRQATSSILQPQYYQQQSSAPRPLVSQPIRLTENIEVQQSFALPTQQSLLPNANNRHNPLVDPKDIKIVPALFVHQHTSVASDGHNNNGRGNSGRNIADAFQTLETAQSTYYPAPKPHLAQQLNHLVSQTPQSTSYSTGPRQFFRRSNNNKNGGSGQSTKTEEPSHTIEKAHQVSTFTLEDARTPEELQKYHHEDLKRFHKENIATHPGVLDEVLESASPAPAPRRTIPVISSIVKESSQKQSRGARKEGPTSSSRELPSVHRNEEYFIPVSGSFAGGSSNGGGSIVRNSNSNSKSSNSNSDNIYSQFRVNGGNNRSRESRGGGGGGGGRSSSSSYQFVDAERSLLSRFLPEEDGGFGSRL